MWKQESLGLVSWISPPKIYLSLFYKETENVHPLLLRCAYCARRKSPFFLFPSIRLKPNYRIVQAIFSFSFKKNGANCKENGTFYFTPLSPFCSGADAILMETFELFRCWERKGLRVPYLLSLLHSL